MKSFNTAFLLLATATLTIGAASAQTSPNTKPDPQSVRQTLRGLPGNAQAAATLRSARRIDHDSYVSQVGVNNYARVDQTGDDQSANMIQVSFGSPVNGNDGYQRQSNGMGMVGQNVADMAQYGNNNYADQAQAGTRNVAIAEQGNAGSRRAAKDDNYSVQCQTGANNYGYVDQDSNGNFAHQDQTSPIATSTIGNFADTRQGNGLVDTGTNGADAQWSQVVQNGQNNRAIVRQDHD